MALIQDALHQALLDVPQIVDRVGDRIAPHRTSQGEELPRVTYEKVSGNHTRHLSGRSGLAEARYQLNCFGATYEDAKLLFEEVRKALDGEHHRNLGSGQHLVYMRGLFLDNEFESTEESELADDTAISGVHGDFIIWHNEV